ncbi:MAG: nitrilase-related carbon-nitrogen hydrolase [Minisyncoccia bacterium]|jgi:apolipoprotein N-acyltransferase
MWLPVLSALASIIVFSPMNFYPAVFVFLVPLFLFFLREKKLWRLMSGAVLFRLLLALGTAYFTVEPMLWISSLFIFLGLPVSVFLFKKFVDKTASLPTLVFLPFIWTFFDLLEARCSLAPTYIMTAGNALGSSPFLGLAGTGGLVALTFFAAVINVLVAALVMCKKRDRFSIAPVVAIVVLLFSGWQISNVELRRNVIAYDDLPNSFTVAAVSTNGTFTADSFKELVQELASRKTDLIVFPEDMFNQRTSSSIFQNAAKELHADILAAYDTFQGGNKYNSAILFDIQGNIIGIHNKNRLTFIGEYWPFGTWHPSFYTWLGGNNPEMGTYAIFNPGNADSPGARNLLSATFQKNPVLFAAPICLEIHYPDDMQEYRSEGAQFIVNQSSNRWVSTGLAHFLYLATNLKKIEAVWLKLPIISSGVDDVAGIILPNGQAQLVNYQTRNKNYNIFLGTVRY